MWLSFPWRPTKQVVLGALLIACVIFGLLGLTQLIPDGAVKDVVQSGFRVLVLLFVAVMVILAISARVRRAEDEGWNQWKDDD